MTDGERCNNGVQIVASRRESVRATIASALLVVFVGTMLIPVSAWAQRRGGGRSQRGSVHFADRGGSGASNRGGPGDSNRGGPGGAGPGGAGPSGNRQSFRAGQQVGRHQGYNAGFHHGYRSGFHHGVYAHPWAFRGPTVWGWHPFGFFVATLATTAIIVSVVDSSGNESSSGNVYYEQGLYYEKTADGYKVISPPAGAKIPALPEGYTSVTQGGTEYGYYQGDFYVVSGSAYVVTKAPVGAIVPYVPDSATETDQAGTKYYDNNGTRYQAVALNGDTSYLVTGPTP